MMSKARRLLTAVSLPLLAGFVLALPLPAQGATELASATFLYLDSDQGDPIGDGMTYLASPTPPKMHIQGARNGHTMWITVEQGQTEVLLFLENQTKKPIRTGAHRFESADYSAYEFVIAGWGRGCGASKGKVNIRQLEFDRHDQVSRLDLSFTSTCMLSGNTAQAHGRVAYRSTKPVTALHNESVLQTGATLTAAQSLTNINGVEGGTSFEDEGGTNYEDTANRLVLRNGQVQLIRRMWPSYYTREYTDTVVWSTLTAGSKADRLTVRKDGSLALLTKSGKAVWVIKPKGAARGDFLLVNNDGTLVLVNPRFKPLWTVG